MQRDQLACIAGRDLVRGWDRSKVVDVLKCVHLDASLSGCSLFLQGRLAYGNRLNTITVNIARLVEIIDLTADMTLSSQESDFYLDDGDDLVKAFLEQEQEAGITIKQAGTQGRRSRTRSASPGPANPHGMGVKVKVEAKGSQPKSLKLDRSPSLEIIDVKSANKLENGPVLKQEPTSSSPIIIVEAPVSWPPSKVPASNYIKEAHATHRKYMAGTSTPQSSSDGRRGDHQTQVKRDEEMNPVIKKRKTTASFKGKVEEVVMRNEQGNLTEQGRRALDKRLLESLGHEENAITNSDLYSR